MAIIEGGQSSSQNTGDPIIRGVSGRPNAFALTGSLNERIARVVNERFQQSENYCKPRFERFYRYEKLINMVSKKKSMDWKANAYLPYALSVSEQSAAIKYLALMGSRPWVTVTPRQAGLDEVADHRQALLDWRFQGDIDLPTFAAEMLRMAERYGKAIAIVAPDWDQKILKYRSAVNLPTVYGPIARMVWKNDTSRAYKIRCEILDLTDVFPQPGAKRINGKKGMRWIIRRYYLTIDELYELEANGMFGESVGGEPVSSIRDTQTQELNEFKARRLYMDKYDDYDLYRDQFDRTVEILEYQGAVPEELIDPGMANAEVAAGLNPKERLMVMCNRKVIGINQAIPWDHGFKSYVEMDSVPNPYDFWGVGKVEPIEHLVYVGNEIVNMRLDNVKAAINGLIGVDGTRMPAGWKRRLVSQPWGVIESLGPPQQVIQRLQLGDVTAQAYQEQSAIFALIQEASAINETLLGAPGGPVRTLGEQQLKAQSASNRLNFELVYQAAQLFGATRVNPGLVHFILALDRQYLPLPQYLSVVDPYAPDDMMEMTVGPTDLATEDENFIYRAQGALEGMSKQSKRLELTQLNQIISPMAPFLLQGGFNLIEYAKAILRAFDEDPDRFFPKMLGTLSPDALGMGGGPQALAAGLQSPGYSAGIPTPPGMQSGNQPMGQPPGMPGQNQPPLRAPGIGGPPRQGRYGSSSQSPIGQAIGGMF